MIHLYTNITKKVIMFSSHKVFNYIFVVLNNYLL